MSSENKMSRSSELLCMSTLSDADVPVTSSFSSLSVKQGDKLTASTTTSQQKDLLISDLLIEIRKNRQLLSEHNFILTELKERKPFAIEDGMKKKKKVFRLVYGVTEVVDKIVADEIVKDALNLRPTDDTTSGHAINIFGCTDIPGSIHSVGSSWSSDPIISLPYDDALKLRRALEQGLARKCNSIIQKHKLSKEVPQNALVPSSMNLFVSRLVQFDDFNLEMNRTNALLTTEYGLYESLADLRVSASDTTFEKQASSWKAKIQLLIAKFRALEMKMNDSVYLENEHILGAINKLNCYLEKEMNTFKELRQKLQRDDESHNEMAGNEAFNKILMEYKELLKLLRQKKSILTKLRR